MTLGGGSGARQKVRGGVVIEVYGLSSCDACRAALRALEQSGRPAQFLDLRRTADLPDRIAAWAGALGAEALLNRRSTTWRSLGAQEQAEALTKAGAVALMCRHPALVKRPVVVMDGEVRTGLPPL